jgi:hypothetical protein
MVLSYKMKSDIYRFAGEVELPRLFTSTLTDRGVGTLRGDYAQAYGIHQTMLDAIQPELTASDHVLFADIEEGRTPDTDRLLDWFEDATGGISPGHPTIKCLDDVPDVTPESMLGTNEVIAKQLQKFYRLTKMRPRLPVGSVVDVPAPNDSYWGGDASKFFARIRLPSKNPQMRSLLHELGHCSMPVVGFGRSSYTKVEGSHHSVNVSWNTTTFGLQYEAEGGEPKGAIPEEAIAEGLGSLVNRKLGLVKTRHNDDTQQLPSIVAPYMVGKGFASSAPSAVALELIADELDIPSERYFKMFVDYANAGVLNTDARQEVAETVYRGSRGRLTLGQVEELPYPINKEASLALLWAVEDALDVPDHQRYSDLFIF